MGDRSWRGRARQIRSIAQALGLAGGGIGAGIAGQRYMSAPSPALAGRAKKKRKLSAKRSVGAKLKVDGVSSGVYVTSKKRKKKNSKKKFSAKREIAKLKRNIPKMSTKTYRDFKTMVINSTSPNNHRVYDIVCFDKNIFDDYAASLTKVDTGTVADYTTSKSKIKMSQYYKLMCKNNNTTNIEIQYAFYVCKDDDNESPIKCLKEELESRGYLSVPTVTDLAPSTATSSEQPAYLGFGATAQFHAPAFSGGAISRNWKIQGGVKSMILGPGDTSSLVWTRKNFTYNQEELDQEAAFTHIKGYSVHLVMSVKGSLCHDNTNTTLIGHDKYQLDMEEQRQNIVRYANPKGLREVEYTDNLTNTNFSTPVHADNFVSAIEEAFKAIPP